jgi:nitric oxide reductase subunit B
LLRSQHLSYKYALLAYVLFGLQGLVATGGALELIFPDIPSPISYASGRAFHLNISIYWPLIGIIGAVYFFFSQEAERELASLKLVTINFWLLAGTTALVLGSLLLGFTTGREYLEAMLPLKVATAASTLMLCYNLICTYRAPGVPRNRATLISMVAGSVTLIVFYLPNLVSYAHPTTDEMAKFLVVHVWEEMSLELIGTGVLAALLLKVAKAERKAVEMAIYLDITLVALAGILATGHHYYWIGVPAFWLWIGGIFSAMQALPAIILVYSTIKTAQFTTYSSLSARDKITITLIGCSTFYHIFGASILGFFMAYPPINRFIHGTYITSAHSHFALFGVFGFLILAVCFYILFTEVVLGQKMYRFCQMAILALNAGLLTMGIGLLLAGGLQCYFWRVIGLSISETNELIRPYLFIRAFGGGIYATGSMLLTFVVLKSIWPKIREIFRTSGKIGSIKYDDIRHLQQLLQELIKKEKEAERLLIKIRKLSQVAETQNKLKQ